MKNPRRMGRVNIKVLVIVLIVLGVLGGGAVVGHFVRKRITADRAFAAGQAAFVKKDWTEAAKHLKRYLQKYPDDVPTLEQYCEANMSVRPVDPEHVGAAIGAYRRLLRHRPGDAVISAKLAKLYYGVGEYADAVHIGQQRLAADGDDPDALYWVGRALSAQAKNAEAAEVLRQLVEKHPDRIKAYALLSGLALQGDSRDAKDTALDWLNRAVTVNPQSSEALAQRARFHRVVTRDRDAAQTDLDAAAALGFDDPVVQLVVADEWVEWGEFAKAAEGLTAVTRVDPASLEAHDLDEVSLGYAVWGTRAKMALRDPEHVAPGDLADQALAAMEGKFRTRFLSTAVELYLAGGRVPDADRCLTEYKEARAAGRSTGPPSREELVLSARVANAAGRPYEAISSLLGSGQSMEDDSSAQRALADAFFATGQIGRAREALRRYVDRVPQDRLAMLRLAEAYRNEQWDRVQAYADAALRLRPVLGAKLLSLEARMMLAAGRAGERATLEEIQREGAELRKQLPNDAGVRMLTAAAMSRAGKTDEAVAELSGAIAECEPKLPAELQLVDLYARSGRMDEALAAARRTADAHGDSSQAWLVLADVQRRAGHADESQNSLTDAAARLTGDDRLTVRRALARELVLDGKRNEAAALLRALGEETPSDAEDRVSLLALPEIRRDSAEASRLIAELKAVEGDLGVRWKLEQARLWLESDAWRSRRGETIDLLQACLRADPRWEGPSLVLAAVYDRSGNLRDAEQTLRVAVTNNPLAFTAVDRLVDLLKRQGRYAEAEQVLDAFPGAGEAFGMQRIELAMGRGDYDQAIRRLELHAAAYPEDTAAKIRLARLVFAARKDRPRAEALLNDAAAQQPDSLEVLRARISLLHTTGEEEAAVSLIDAEAEKRNDFGVYWLRAQYMAETGRLDRAEEDYKHLTTFADQASAGYALLAEFHLSRDRRGDAVGALEAGLKLDPDGARLNRSLMKVLVTSPTPEDRVRGRGLLAELQSQSTDDPELMRIEGALLLDDRTVESDARAKEKLERVVELNPTDAGSYLLLVNLARRQRDFERARALASRALSTNPTNLTLQVARISVEVDLGANRVARELGQRVLDEHGSDLSLANQLNDIFRRAGDAESAAVFSARAMAVGPHDEYANIAWAASLVAKGEVQAAVEHLTTFSKSDAGAGSVAAHLALASLGTSQRDFAASEAALARADQLAPADAGAARERMKLLAAQERYDEVVKVLSEVRANHGDDAVTLVAGGYALAAASDAGPLREARSAFEAASQADPRNLDAYRGLANVTFRTGDIDAAVGAYRAMLNVAPQDAGALNDLAWILAAHKGASGLAEGERIATRGVTRYPDDVHLLDTRGVILFKLGRHDDARRDLEKCRKLAESQPGTLAAASLHLAQVLAAQGGDAAAIRPLLDEARKIDEEQRVLSDEDRAMIAKLLGSL